MKNFIVLMIFAIGLMVALPSTSSGSGLPPGQVSFISHVDFAPAAMLQVNTVNPVTYEVIYFKNAANLVAQKGGCTVDQSYKTLIDAGYLNKEVITSEVPTYTMVYNYDFRLCLHSYGLINRSTTQKNTQSAGPITIRADTRI